jgi:hypothetical protein
MKLENWIPSIIAVGALGTIWFWLRKAIDDIKEQVKLMNAEILRMKCVYLEEEKHVLICHANVLEIEKAFKKCFDEYKDSIFTKFRDLEKKIDELHSREK